MTNPIEGGFTPEQEVILSEAPYLKAFLTYPADPEGEWFDQIEPFAQSSVAELAEFAETSHWESTTVFPVMMAISPQKVFNQDITIERDSSGFEIFYRTIRTLFLIGYQLNERKNAHKFISPIVKKLEEAGLFTDPKGRHEIHTSWDLKSKCVSGAMSAGLALWTLINTDHDEDLPNSFEPESPTQIPPVFKNFLQTLDLGDLEEK